MFSAMLSYGGLEGYGLGSNRSCEATSSTGCSTVYVVLSAMHWRRRRFPNNWEVQAECVYSNQEMAYAHAMRRCIEDGGACLDEEGLGHLGRISKDMAALSMPFRECWKRVHEFLEQEQKRTDWDVWPDCWVQETQLNVRRESGGPMRVLEGLDYVFSDEAAEDDEDENGENTNDDQECENEVQIEKHQESTPQ